jgi:hypothetical protein
MPRISLIVATLGLAACEFPSGPPPEPLSACDGDAGFNVAITDAVIDADTLVLTVERSGGCEDWLYTVCWPDQSFMESMPLQVRFELLATGEPDMCEAWLTETVEQDLTPLRETYAQQYGADYGTVVIDIGEQSVEYTFGGS